MSERDPLDTLQQRIIASALDGRYAATEERIREVLADMHTARIDVPKIPNDITVRACTDDMGFPYFSVACGDVVIGFVEHDAGSAERDAWKAEHGAAAQFFDSQSEAVLWVVAQEAAMKAAF